MKNIVQPGQSERGALGGLAPDRLNHHRGYPGWRLAPLERCSARTTTEYYFCSIDGGAFTAMAGDRGVANFPGLDGTQIIVSPCGT